MQLTNKAGKYTAENILALFKLHEKKYSVAYGKKHEEIPVDVIHALPEEFQKAFKDKNGRGKSWGLIINAFNRANVVRANAPSAKVFAEKHNINTNKYTAESVLALMVASQVKLAKPYGGRLEDIPKEVIDNLPLKFQHIFTGLKYGALKVAFDRDLVANVPFGTSITAFAIESGFEKDKTYILKKDIDIASVFNSVAWQILANDNEREHIQRNLDHQKVEIDLTNPNLSDEALEQKISHGALKFKASEERKSYAEVLEMVKGDQVPGLDKLSSSFSLCVFANKVKERMNDGDYTVPSRRDVRKWMDEPHALP